MEFKEINIPEVIIRQIDHKGPVAGITVDAGTVDIVCTNVNLDVSYEDTFEDIENTMGSVPVFIRSLPKKSSHT